MANALLVFVHTTKAIFDSIPLLHILDIHILSNDYKALEWAVEELFCAVFIETTCKQVHFSVIYHSCILNGTQYFPLYRCLLYGNRVIYEPL